MADDWLAQHPLVNPPPTAGVAAGPPPSSSELDIERANAEAPSSDWLKAHPLVPGGGAAYAPGEDALRPVAPYGWREMLAHGLSFGVSDPMQAAVQAAADWAQPPPGLPVRGAPPGPPAPPGFDYQKRAEEQAAGRRLFEAEYPKSSTLLNATGALAAFPQALPRLAAWGIPALSRFAGSTAEAAPAMWRQILGSTGVGATGGAVTGAADTPEAPLAGAAQYATGGAIAGAAAPIVTRGAVATGRGISNLWNPEANAERNAIDKLRGIVGQDTSVGHPDLGALDQRLLAANSPLTLADVSPGTRRYVGSLYDRNTPAATMIGNELERRDAGAQTRLLGGLDRLSATGPETFEADALMKANQQTKAGALYGDAYMQPPVNPDLVAPGGDIHALIDTPAGKQAMNNALKIAAQDRVSPQSLGITFNAAGDPVFTGVPSWQTLHYVKQGFDDVLSSYARNPLTGRRELDVFGGKVAKTLGEYRDALVRENPAYGKALSVYSGDASARDALDMGSHALAPGLPAAEQMHMFNQLSPGDQELYRLGAANALRLKIRSTPDLGDETKRIANSTEMRDKLRPLFSTDERYNDFVNGIVRDERTIFETNQRIAGNSFSASRLGAMGKEEPGGLAAAVPVAAGALMGGAGLGTAAAAGGMGALMGPVKGWLNRISDRLAGQSPQAQNVAANLALAPGGREVMGLLQAPQMRYRAPWLPLTVAGATAGETGPALLQQGLLSMPPPYRRER
jgi:hypothetical protein